MQIANPAQNLSALKSVVQKMRQPYKDTLNWVLCYLKILFMPKLEAPGQYRATDEFAVTIFRSSDQDISRDKVVSLNDAMLIHIADLFENDSGKNPLYVALVP